MTPKTDVDPFIEALASGKTVKEIAYENNQTYWGFRRMLHRRVEAAGARTMIQFVVMHLSKKHGEGR